MKKLFLCLVLFLVVLFPLDATAAETNITHGKPFIISTGAFLPGTSTDILSDGELNTKFLFLEDAYKANGKNTAWMTFDKTYDVTKVYQGGNRAAGIRFDFYDDSKNLIQSFTPSATEGKVNVKGVRHVAAVNVYKGIDNAVYELIVWGLTDEEPPGEVSGIVSSNITSKSIKLSWIEPTDDDLAETLLYRDNVLIQRIKKGVSTFTDTELQPSTRYVYKFVTVDALGNQSLGVTHAAETAQPDTTPPGEITNIKTTVYNDRIRVTWTNPPDLDFLEVRIFKEGVLVAVAVTPATQFTDYDLEEHTTYTYLFRTVDDSGNVSPGVSVTEKTKGKPPKVTGLVGVPGYAKAELYFLQSSDPEVTHYNIYQNGAKVMSNLKDTVALITGLENEKTYQFQVTAVSPWGESELSDIVEITPVSQLPSSIQNLRVIEKKTDRMTFGWDKDPTAEQYQIDLTITHNQTAALNWTAGSAPTTTKTLETTDNQVTITDLSPGDRVEIAVSLVNAIHGVHGTARLTEAVPTFEIPDLGPGTGIGNDLFTPRDVFDSSVSLASNFWLYLLLGLAFVVGPWIYYLIVHAAKKPKPQADTATRTVRAQQRDIRLSLRRGDPRG